MRNKGKHKKKKKTPVWFLDTAAALEALAGRTGQEWRGVDL